MRLSAPVIRINAVMIRLYILERYNLIMQRAEFKDWHTWDGDELDDNGDNIAFCDGGF